MPTLEVHNKWAGKIGISEGISHFVNTLIDYPSECQEFVEYCETNVKIWYQGRKTSKDVALSVINNMGKNKQFAKKIRLGFLSQKGSDYLKAYYLHQMLDYISFWNKEDTGKFMNSNTYSSLSDEILVDKQIRREIGLLKNPAIIAISQFIIKNAREIWQDCSGK